MSQDNVLKKEFSKKDVQRLRNVFTGKTGDRTTDGVGYTKKQEFHKEGDVWTENGREWTIKDGIKQNVTKLDKAKEAVMPLFCPSCNKVMKKHQDPAIYKMFRRCHDCQAEFEMRLRFKGLWDEYQKMIDNAALENIQEHMKDWLNSALNESNQSFVSEDGEVQNWKGGINKELAYKNLEETIKYLESLKK
jgi:hypothetical protein